MEYIDRLMQHCELARAAVPVREFVAATPGDLDGIVQGIYIIRELGGDAEATFAAFSDFKRTKARACARLNAPSPVLYVGSSTTGLKKRIADHMGDGCASTYALHLKHWFQGTCEVTVKVYDVPAAVLQILEDALAHELKPAFGKMGANNR